MSVGQLEGNKSDAYPALREAIGQRSDIYHATEMDQEARIAYELGVAAHEAIMKRMAEAQSTVVHPVIAAGRAAMEFLRMWEAARRFNDI